MKYERIISRVVAVWITIIATFLILTYEYTSEAQKQFYRFGPSEDLVLIGLTIDTWYKYFVLILYCFINTMLRTACYNVLKSWITNVIQDVTRKKPREIFWFAYEADIVYVVYLWSDWYIYLNMIFTQIDMVVIEICTDLFASVLITTYYLKHEENYATETAEELVKLV